MEGNHPLERSWVLWEMWDQNDTNDTNETVYLQKIQSIFTFHTAEDFWHHWSTLPHCDPRKLFSNYQENYTTVVEGLNKTVEAFALFEEGVNPTWEDPVNTLGADFSIKRAMNLETLKNIWEKLVFTLIGENLALSKAITGCRIVDKQRGQYKVEVWFRFTPDAYPEYTEMLQKAIQECFSGLINQEFRTTIHATRKNFRKQRPNNQTPNL